MCPTKNCGITKITSIVWKQFKMSNYCHWCDAADRENAITNERNGLDTVCYVNICTISIYDWVRMNMGLLTIWQFYLTSFVELLDIIAKFWVVPLSFSLIHICLHRNNPTYTAQLLTISQTNAHKCANLSKWSKTLHRSNAFQAKLCLNMSNQIICRIAVSDSWGSKLAKVNERDSKRNENMVTYRKMRFY